MSAELRVYGLRDMIRRMERMPDELQARTGDVVATAAKTATSELKGELPIGPGRWVNWDGGRRWAPGGTLRQRVRMQRQTETRYVVLSTAPHSYINEYGTKDRRTKKGAFRGASKPSKVFRTVASRVRRTMYGALEGVFAKAIGTLR